MEIDDIRQNIDNAWVEAIPFWKDNMSKKYKIAVIDELDELLKSMQSIISELELAREDALRKLKEIGE